MRDGERWTRDELLVAMNVYEKLPFGQFDQANAVVQHIAQKLERTPGSLAMKLCNLASLDPALKARGRKGLDGASKLDRAVWDEFQASPDICGAESEEAFRRLFTVKEADDVELVKGVGVRVSPSIDNPVPPSGSTEQQATVMVRRGQQFFRQMILNAFDGRCCVTGIAIRELLVASHILPWGAFPANRLHLGNGLCLSRLHDGAFDRGLITFDAEMRLVLGRSIKEHLPQSSLEQNFVAFAGKPIVVPEKSMGPDVNYLRYHRENIFRA